MNPDLTDPREVEVGQEHSAEVLRQQLGRKVLPRSARLWTQVLRLALRFHWRWRHVLYQIAHRAHGGITPKHLYSWGTAAFFLRHIPENATVLDLGCGEGTLTSQLARRASLVVACDSSAGSLARAHRLRPPGNVFYVCCDLNNLDVLGAKVFDVAILSSLLSFLDDEIEFLRGLRDRARSIVVRETRFDDSLFALLSQELGVRKSPWKEYTRDELVRVVRDGGWHVTHEWHTFDMFVRAVPKR